MKVTFGVSAKKLAVVVVANLINCCRTACGECPEGGVDGRLERNVICISSFAARSFMLPSRMDSSGG